MRYKSKIILIGLVVLICGVILFVIYPNAVDIYASLQNYRKRIADQADYTKITTPLPRDVVDDICSKFEIDQGDGRCLQDSVVYGPDFFPDILAYFKRLPRHEAQLETVHDKLGPYLESCDTPDNEGYYRCWYDLRGDGIYSVVIFFTKEGNIYRVIANSSGS